MSNVEYSSKFDGQDNIWAGAGNDIVFGGTYADNIYGDNGADVIISDLGVLIVPDPFTPLIQNITSVQSSFTNNTANMVYPQLFVLLYI